MSVDTRTGTRMLQRSDCLRRLADDVFGRLAIIDGGTPVILPVNYVLDGAAIVFRTEKGLKLNAGPLSPACFEIDEVDRGNHTGWSVVVTGRLEEVTDYDTAAWRRAISLPIHPWASGEKAHWMRLVPSRITGREVGTRVRPSAQ